VISPEIEQLCYIFRVKYRRKKFTSLRISHPINWQNVLLEQIRLAAQTSLWAAPKHRGGRAVSLLRNSL
jgi:hypothetical protein